MLQACACLCAGGPKLPERPMPQAQSGQQARPTSTSAAKPALAAGSAPALQRALPQPKQKATNSQAARLAAAAAAASAVSSAPPWVAGAAALTRPVAASDEAWIAEAAAAVRARNPAAVPLPPPSYTPMQQAALAAAVAGMIAPLAGQAPGHLRAAPPQPSATVGASQAGGTTLAVPGTSSAWTPACVVAQPPAAARPGPHCTPGPLMLPVSGFLVAAPLTALGLPAGPGVPAAAGMLAGTARPAPAPKTWACQATGTLPAAAIARNRPASSQRTRPPSARPASIQQSRPTNGQQTRLASVQQTRPTSPRPASIQQTRPASGQPPIPQATASLPESPAGPPPAKKRRVRVKVVLPPGEQPASAGVTRLPYQAHASNDRVRPPVGTSHAGAARPLSSAQRATGAQAQKALSAPSTAAIVLNSQSSQDDDVVELNSEPAPSSGRPPARNARPEKRRADPPACHLASLGKGPAPAGRTSRGLGQAGSPRSPLGFAGSRNPAQPKMKVSSSLRKLARQAAAKAASASPEAFEARKHDKVTPPLLILMSAT